MARTKGLAQNHAKNDVKPGSLAFGKKLTVQR